MIGHVPSLVQYVQLTNDLFRIVRAATAAVGGGGVEEGAEENGGSELRGVEDSRGDIVDQRSQWPG